MSGLGKQAIPVSMRSVEDDFTSAIARSADFGMRDAEAIETWRDVARGVARWKEVFTGLGVLEGDIADLFDFIDRDDKLFLRGESVIDTLPASGSRPKQPTAETGESRCCPRMASIR